MNFGMILLAVAAICIILPIATSAQVDPVWAAGTENSYRKASLKYVNMLKCMHGQAPTNWYKYELCPETNQSTPWTNYLATNHLFQHDRGTSGIPKSYDETQCVSPNGYGENIAMGMNSQRQIRAFNEAEQDYYSEVDLWDFRYENAFVYAAGHFTAHVWKGANLYSTWHVITKNQAAGSFPWEQYQASHMGATAGDLNTPNMGGGFVANVLPPDNKVNSIVCEAQVENYYNTQPGQFFQGSSSGSTLSNVKVSGPIVQNSAVTITWEWTGPALPTGFTIAFCDMGSTRATKLYPQIRFDGATTTAGSDTVCSTITTAVAGTDRQFVWTPTSSTYKDTVLGLLTVTENTTFESSSAAGLRVKASTASINPFECNWSFSNDFGTTCSSMRGGVDGKGCGMLVQHRATTCNCPGNASAPVNLCAHIGLRPSTTPCRSADCSNAQDRCTIFGTYLCTNPNANFAPTGQCTPRKVGATCGAGVNCLVGVCAAGQFCDESATVPSCVDQSTQTYSFESSTWSSCLVPDVPTAQCGAGKQFRNSICIGSKDKKVYPDSKCGTTTPRLQDCTLPACESGFTCTNNLCQASQPQPVYTYTYTYGTCTPISSAAVCGSHGTQTATATCNIDGAPQSSTTSCQTAIGAPQTSRACDLPQCSNNGSCGNQGTCTCPVSYYGSTCQNAVTLASAIVTDSNQSNTELTEIILGTAIQVRIDYRGPANNRLQVQLLLQEGGAALDIGTFVIPELGTGLQWISVIFPATLTNAPGANRGVRASILPPSGNDNLIATASTASNKAVSIFEWTSSQWTPACTGICGAITQTRTNSCQKRAATTTPATPTDCQALNPPLTSQSCPNRETCANGGTCGTDNICQCTTGWTGDTCSTSDTPTIVTLTSATLTASATSDAAITEIDFGSQYYIHFVLSSGSGTGLTISATIKSSPTSSERLLSQFPATEPFAITIPEPSSEFTFTATTQITLTIVETSSTTTISNLALRRYEWNAPAYGSCPGACGTSTRTRVIACQRITAPDTVTAGPDALCPVDRPTTTEECQVETICHAAGGSCENNQCKCNPNWSGELCEVQSPGTCSSTGCANGGFKEFKDDDDTAAGCEDTCTCVDNWTNPTAVNQDGCTVCGLVCSPVNAPRIEGKSAKDCSQCFCRRGSRGPQCGCGEIYFSLVLNNLPAYFVAGDSNVSVRTTPSQSDATKQKEYFNAVLQAAGLSSDRSTSSFVISRWSVITTTTRKLEITIGFALSCPATDVFTVLATTATAADYTMLEAIVEDFKSDSSVYSLVPTEPQATSSPVDSTITAESSVYDPNCTTATDCPTGSDPFVGESEYPGIDDPAIITPPDEEKKDDGVPFWAWIIVGVGGFLVVCLVVAIIVCAVTGAMCFGGSSGSTRSSKQSNKDSHEVQMQEQQPYTQNPMTAPVAPGGASPKAPVAPAAPGAPGAQKKAPVAPTAPQEQRH